MSWEPRDDEVEYATKQPGRYRFSQSLCECDMCDADPAEETELETEEFQ